MHDGPKHQEQEAFTPDCTGCHREHRGREALPGSWTAIAWIVTRTSSVSTASRASLPPRFTRIGDHPEFAVVRESKADPGTVRFNHEMHLRSDLPDPDGGAAKLDCATCHVPDAERRYMQPVKFDNQCKRCHPLTVQVVLEGGDERLRQEARRLAREPLPHGQPPSVVDAVAFERLLQFADKNPAVLEQTPPESKRPFPGKAPSATQRFASSRSWADHQQQYVRLQLFEGAAGCRFCHQVAPERDSRGLPQVAPSNIPQRWMKDAEFDHAKHRLLNCDQCHENVTPALVSGMC